MSGFADTVPDHMHPKSCSRWFASDSVTGESICDCGLAAESTAAGLYQHDLGLLMIAAGLSDHARADSAHMAVHDVLLPRIKEIAAGVRVTGDAGLRALVDEQAEDEGLWFFAQTAPEAYLQQELRRLHAAVEAVEIRVTGDTPNPCPTCGHYAADLDAFDLLEAAPPSDTAAPLREWIARQGDYRDGEYAEGWNAALNAMSEHLTADELDAEELHPNAEWNR